MLLRDPFSGDLLEVSKAYPIALPVQSSTPVTPLHPSGPHVSRVNDLKRFRRRSKMPPDSRVQVFHSGSQTQMKGGGAAFGRRASRVTKSDSLRQPIVGGGADKGYRGSPLSELGRHNRHGTRIPR